MRGDVVEIAGSPCRASSRCAQCHIRSVLPGDNGVQGHLDGPLSRRIVRHHNELAVLKVVEDRRVTGSSYEIRRWRGGSIVDANEAVSNPVRVANDLARAE
jgi:hypothetical protein